MGDQVGQWVSDGTVAMYKGPCNHSRECPSCCEDNPLVIRSAGFSAVGT